jgi:hypothetical protein
MSTKRSLKRWIGLGTWITLVAFALVFLLRWSGGTKSQKPKSSGGANSEV